MTMYYTERDERILAEKREAQKPGLEGSIELFMCSDGNYRDVESKARFEQMREEIRAKYLPY